MPVAMEEELTVLPATRSPHGYLTSPLTDNIHMMNDGSLVVVGVPVARTGWQKYTMGDLPRAKAEDLGLDTSNLGATIDLYRPAKEVFHPEFLASLNGRPITDGHPPKGEFVTPDNFNKYAMGHIQNVRKGLEPLDDGEWPVIADLVVSSKQLIDKIINKIARENSLGYDFGIERDGDKIIQCNMLGNHNAVVPKGRAGDNVRIEDAAPDELDAAVRIEGAAPEEVISDSSLALTAEHAVSVYPPIVVSFQHNKEKQPVAEKKQNWLRSLMGKHLIEMARATDADPAKIMDEVEGMQEPIAADKTRAKDDAEPPKDDKEDEFKSDDKKAKDMNEDGGAMDGKAADRKKMHDALDSALDSKAADAKATDSYSELKKMLDDFAPKEEAKEEEEQSEDDADMFGLEAVLAGEGEDCPDCGMAHDSEECPGEEETEAGEEELVGDEEGESPDSDSDDDQEDVEAKDSKARDGKAADRSRAADGVMEVLRVMRPFAARSPDKKFKAAFDAALGVAKKSSRTSNGGYGKFAASARARDNAPRNPKPDRARAGDGAGKPDPITNLQKFYDDARMGKGGK